MKRLFVTKNLSYDLILDLGFIKSLKLDIKHSGGKTELRIGGAALENTELLCHIEKKVSRTIEVNDMPDLQRLLWIYEKNLDPSVGIKNFETTIQITSKEVSVTPNYRI